MAHETDISLGYVLTLTRLPKFCPHKIMVGYEKILMPFNKRHVGIEVWYVVSQWSDVS
jgi:hypothetical protein